MMIDAAQVNVRLLERGEEVCRMLLPNGKRVKTAWATGNLRDADGGSLKVELEGAKAGVWHDFAETDVGGKGLLSLWMAAKNIEFREAIQEAKKFLGIRDDWRPISGHTRVKPKVEERDLSEDYRPLTEGGPVWKYLTEERGLTPETLAKFGIGESKKKDFIVFPYFSETGKLKYLKFLGLDRVDGIKKVFVLPKNPRHLLFGLPTIPPNEQELFITEGEIDTMTMAQMGFPAVSVPFGAQCVSQSGTDENDQWIESSFDWLQRFLLITLAMDNDERGAKATAAIAHRLDRARCRVVIWPDGVKDANECLVNGMKQEEFYAIVGEAKNLDPPELKKPSDFADAVWSAFYPGPEGDLGDPLPWNLPFRLRPKEATVIHGFTKDGKTALLTFVLTWLAANRHRKSCIASLEVPAPQTIQNIMRQGMGKRKPADDKEFSAAMDWMDEWLWIYNKVSTVNHKEVLITFRYVAQKYGVHYFVLDSLMRTDIDEDDNNAQKTFMNDLLAFADEMDVHIFLVAHDKKPDAKHPQEKHWSTKYGVRGSAHIVDLAHNTICVWRNRFKEGKLAIAQEAATKNSSSEAENEIKKLKLMNDAILAVQAQRGGDGEEPVKRLWFDSHESWQYFDHVNQKGTVLIEGLGEEQEML
ncbi:MAG: toprim domain-containing protein [bacterium]